MEAISGLMIPAELLTDQTCKFLFKIIFQKKKCIELNKIIYEMNEDIFYQPIPRYNDDKPLQGCVITISGYNNNEKEMIGNFCKLLGAVLQNSLSLKEQPSGLKANTHLISKLASGPKYSAAKSWRIPILSPEWLVDCCITGIKAEENKYLLDHDYNYQDLFDFAAKCRKNLETLTASSYGVGTNPSASRRDIETTNDSCLAQYLNSSKNIYDENLKVKVGSKAIDNQDKENPDENEPVNSHDLSLSFHNEPKKPRLESNTPTNDNGN